MIEGLNQKVRPATLRVGAVASAVSFLVPVAVKQLCTAWPSLEVLVVEGDDDELAEWLLPTTIDLAVSTVPIGDPADALTISDELLAVPPKLIDYHTVHR
jgi:DNA-binding transcriptional LysR family regulator